MHDKRCVFIVSGKSPVNLPGGLGAYAMNLARIFASLDYRVFIVGFGEVDEEFERDGVCFMHVRTPYNALFGLGVGLMAPYFTRAIRRKIAELGACDILVYGMATWNYVGIRLQRQCPRLNLKTLVSCFTTHRHELYGHVRGAPVRDYGWAAACKYRLAYYLDLAFLRHYDRKAITGADRVIIHYASTRRIIEADYGPLGDGRICQTPYCVELYKRSSREQQDKQVLGRGKERPWVVVICRQDPRKGMNTFIRAIARLVASGRDFDCYVVGSGPFLEDNKRLAARLGLAEHIRFLGFVDDIRPFLLGADVYVLPSIEEGSGAISLLEAMKLGVPIVTTRCDGIPEDFTHEQNALLVDIGDAADMACQIDRLLEDRTLREALSAQARRDYRARFTFEAMQQAMARISAGLWQNGGERHVRGGADARL